LCHPATVWLLEASNYGVIRSLIEMHAGIPYGEIGWHIAAACTQSHFMQNLGASQ
jgi:hypothetical protein